VNTEQGNYTLYQDGQLIIFIASGPWNSAGSMRCLDDIRCLIDQIDENEFAIIMDTSRGEGLTLGCFDIWIEAIDDWYTKGFKAAIRVDNRADINYRIFSEPFDAVLKPIVGLGYAKNIAHGIKVLQRRGYKGFEDSLENATRFSNCSELGLPSNFLQPSILK
jgi:hypothetical protein